LSPSISVLQAQLKCIASKLNDRLYLIGIIPKVMFFDDMSYVHFTL